MIIKVCGITNADDALLCLESGADALGLNFYPNSPRFVTTDQAARILEALDGGILKIGVRVLGTDPPREANDLVDLWQIHGARTPNDLKGFGPDTWVAVSPEAMRIFAGHPLIVDTSWGRGIVADWSTLADCGMPYVLSGGLDCDNVAEAVRRLRPRGVDVCSGVEKEPGRKDAERVRRFMREARAAQRELESLQHREREEI